MEDFYIQSGKFGSKETWYTRTLKDVPKDDTDLRRHQRMHEVRGKLEPQQLTLTTGNLVHVTTVKRAANIIKCKSIKGGEKEFKGVLKSLNLFWCGLCFDQMSEECREYKRSMARALSLHPEELDLCSSCPFQESSRYGNVKFTFSFDAFLEMYEDMIECSAQFRILGTFRYKREMNHTILVHPEDVSEIFEALPKLENDNKVKLLPHRSGVMWKPQSTSCQADSWEQVTFAFLMEKGERHRKCNLRLDSAHRNRTVCDIAKPTLANEDYVYESKREAKDALEKLLGEV